MQLRHLLGFLLVVPSALVLSAPVRMPDSVETLYSRAVSVTVEAGPNGDFKKWSLESRPKDCPPNAKEKQKKHHDAQCEAWQKRRDAFLTQTVPQYKGHIQTLLNTAQAAGIAVPNTLTVYLQSPMHSSQDPKAHFTINFKDAGLCQKRDCVAHVRNGGTGQLYGGDPHRELFQNLTPPPSPPPGSPKSPRRSPSPPPKGGKK